MLFYLKIGSIISDAPMSQEEYQVYISDKPDLEASLISEDEKAIFLNPPVESASVTHATEAGFNDKTIISLMEDEISSLRKEVERLKEENRSLIEQLRQD